MATAERIPAECFPATRIVADELAARDIPLDAFLSVIGMSRGRWDNVDSGEVGLLLKESQAIAGALGVSMDFIVNLNHGYLRWRKAVRGKSPPSEEC